MASSTKYKVPYLKDKRQRLLLKLFLPPHCKKATREVIDVAFARLQAHMTGRRQLPVIRRAL
jgi:hypothetical protein